MARARTRHDELDCLSEAVYYEARSEDTIGQMAVAEVVMNRVRDPRFPKTICDVVYQGQYRDTGCQFTFTCDGSLRHKPSGDAWDRAKDVALHVMLGLNTPVTNKATHYHTDYVNPYWPPAWSRPTASARTSSIASRRPLGMGDRPHRARGPGHARHDCAEPDLLIGRCPAATIRPTCEHRFAGH